MNTSELTPMLYNRIKNIPNGITFQTSVSYGHISFYHMVYYDPLSDKLMVRNPPESLYAEPFGDKDGRPYAEAYLDALIDEILSDDYTK